MAVAGDTIYLRGGTYQISKQITLTRSGTTDKWINVFAYPGEKPVLDGASISATDTWIIRLTSASWWHIKGLELKNNPKGGGITIGSNSTNDIIENNDTHHNGRLSEWAATGISVYGTSANILILNNDSHHNRDINNDDADGISMGATGAGNVLRGNRVWRNSDDGIDMWNGAPALVENNWSWENGYDDNLQPLADGNGFKLGGNHAGLISGGHMVRNNLSWKNRAVGFVENASPETKPDTLYNNTAWNNGGKDFGFFSRPNTFRNNLAFGPFGVAASGDSASNSWTLPVSVSNGDFASLVDTVARGPRNADGSLPAISFLRLVNGSDLIGRGVNVGLPYSGAAPDLGVYDQ